MSQELLNNQENKKLQENPSSSPFLVPKTVSKVVPRTVSRLQPKLFEMRKASNNHKILNDPSLEKEADEMGKKASEGKDVMVSGKSNSIQQKEDQTAPAAPTEKQLDEIVNRYNSIVAKGRTLGFNVAADNLEHFLIGNGKTKVISATWLRSYSEITNAEEENQSRFERSLDKIADNMKDGEVRTFSDFWDRGLYARGLNELFYASGGSTITSKGSFTLSRKNDIVTITGIVNHHWHDPYDWHEGLTAFVPGFGNVSDADALLLQQYRGAKPFEMESDWQKDLTGHVETNRWTNYFGTKFTWTLK